VTELGIYPILDLAACEARGLDPLETAAVWLEFEPRLLQLRAKHGSDRRVFELVQRLALLTQGSGTQLVLNDRLDFAWLSGCHAVHLGQQDVPAAEARRLCPELFIGLSTHTPRELEAACQERPNYVAYGPIYQTASKSDAEPCVGLTGLAQAAAVAASFDVPLVAIGGIDLSRVPEVARLAQGAAVISAALGANSDEVRANARALFESWSSARRS
jgi:thiamine-phosphate pyrophosphorylase